MGRWMPFLQAGCPWPGFSWRSAFVPKLILTHLSGLCWAVCHPGARAGEEEIFNLPTWYLTFPPFPLGREKGLERVSAEGQDPVLWAMGMLFWVCWYCWKLQNLWGPFQGIWPKCCCDLLNSLLVGELGEVPKSLSSGLWDGALGKNLAHASPSPPGAGAWAVRGVNPLLWRWKAVPTSNNPTFVEPFSCSS